MPFKVLWTLCMLLIYAALMWNKVRNNHCKIYCMIDEVNDLSGPKTIDYQINLSYSPFPQKYQKNVSSGSFGCKIIIFSNWVVSTFFPESKFWLIFFKIGPKGICFSSKNDYYMPKHHYGWFKEIPSKLTNSMDAIRSKTANFQSFSYVFCENQYKLWASFLEKVVPWPLFLFSFL